jgi:hypothetical protein
VQINNNLSNPTLNQENLHHASILINRLWAEEFVNPCLSIKSAKDLNTFFLRLENEVKPKGVEIQRLNGATTALILKVRDLNHNNQIIIKLPFLHKNSNPQTLKLLAGVENERRNLVTIKQLSTKRIIHPEYWQQEALSGEHSINSEYTENDGTLAQVLFGVNSLGISTINPITSLKTTPVEKLINHLTTFLTTNRLPIFADEDIYKIFHDVMSIAGAGVQLTDAGGLQNTLVKQDGRKYKPTIIDFDPHLKIFSDLYQLIFSDNYKEKALEMQVPGNKVLDLVSKSSDGLEFNTFIKIRRIAAALEFGLTKLPMFQQNRGADLRNEIINSVNEKINPDNIPILNLRLQNETQLRRIIGQSVREGSFTKIELKQAINYLKEINHLIPIISKEGIKVLESFRNI